MLSSLNILAVAAVENGEAASGVTKIFQDFGVSVPNILAQVLSFSIVAFVLYRFAFKPVLLTLEDRRQKIASGLSYADEMKAKLEAAAQESAQIIRQAQLDAQKSIDEARKAAKEFGDKQQAEALQRAADILAKAQQAIELEHKKMVTEARTEIARLVVATTERVLARKLTDADRTSYNETAAKELASL
ncbi:MAG TPA: F0F1 ATP synthase subunit B [Candidatus Didemnitutus sp.]|nr:F0F1 ATP synthase subunit B [Candidatus Didemnitutus sp.]